MTENILERARTIHEGNVAAGWWTDLKTDACILATRNRPEMLMLVVSELSEANEGRRTGCMDDKLPHLPMFPVELADAAIRLLDLIGAEESLHGSLNAVNAVAGVDFDLFTRAAYENGVDDLMGVVDLVSAAMEHYRKGRVYEYRLQIMRCLAGVFAVAWAYTIDNLWAIIDEKIAFNAQRADHRPENRRADGGKAF